jgi:hypothetical protein
MYVWIFVLNRSEYMAVDSACTYSGKRVSRRKNGLNSAFTTPTVSWAGVCFFGVIIHSNLWPKYHHAHSSAKKK